MQFVWWLTGVIATITACRFVILVFKRLTSKESLEALIDSAACGIGNAANNVSNKIQKRKELKREKEEATECRVTIR